MHTLNQKALFQIGFKKNWHCLQKRLKSIGRERVNGKKKFQSCNLYEMKTLKLKTKNVYSVNTYIFTQDNPWKLESLFPMGSCIMHGCFALGGHYCGRKPEHPEKTHVSEWATNHTLSHTTTADHGDRTRAALVRSQCATTALPGHPPTPLPRDFQR